MALTTAPPVRKRGDEALLPVQGLSVVDQLGAEGFELSLWMTLTPTRRVAATAGSRF